MSQNQLTRICQFGDRSRFCSSRVFHFFAACSVLVEEGGLVIKRLYPFDDRNDLLVVLRIGTVGVPFGRYVLKRTIFFLFPMGLFEEESAGRYAVL